LSTFEYGTCAIWYQPSGEQSTDLFFFFGGEQLYACTSTAFLTESDLSSHKSRTAQPASYTPAATVPSATGYAPATSAPAKKWVAPVGYVPDRFKVKGEITRQSAW